MQNRKFAKIVDGKLVYAPAVIKVNGRTIIGGKAEHYAQVGYLPVNLSAPSCPEGYHLVADGYTDTDGIIKRVWRTEQDEKIPRVFSKLKCYSALVSMGKWDAVKAWLESNNLWDAFVLAQDVAEDNPMFAQGLAAMQSALEMTDEDVENFLSKCIAE